MQGDILKTFINRLINSPVTNDSFQGLADIFEEVIKVKKCLPNFDIPYEEITEYIYEVPTEINLDDLDLMMEGLETQFVDRFPNNKNGTKHKNHRCLSKFRTHIYLAAVQKNFIKRITQDAQQMASTARNISNLANEAADKAKKSSERAELLALKAEDLANEADAQAKSTIANYISILGIFASIIFTLFGGVNLIGSTVKLLEVNSRWPYLTFVIALLMICLLTLLNMLVKWITSMNNLKKALDKQREDEKITKNDHWYNPLSWDFYTKSVLCFLVVLGISLGGMYNVNKENLFSVTKETTTKNIPSPVNNKPANQLKPEKENKEITVVEKITLSNNVNDKSTDKDKSE
ncbi:hypothetical protein [Acinetobacter terrae]|uniref:hypothetical protein n=1 Tax=Acinetobacter terrae TaxID=2731247 RepID=UPI0007D86B66|nr:hypothetical protein [Acinetobacter terrae]OAL80316.1 hypothetical protein AY608_05415 [Acinetobacter terrae]